MVNKLSGSNVQETFINEKVKEQLQSLGFINQEEDVEKISNTVRNDVQFWNLVNSLFASYIITYVEANQKAYVPVREVL